MSIACLLSVLVYFSVKKDFSNFLKKFFVLFNPFTWPRFGMTKSWKFGRLLWKAALACSFCFWTGLLAVACSELLGIVWCGWLSGGAWHRPGITATYTHLSYTALSLHPSCTAPRGLLLWSNHLDINPTQASNEAYSFTVSTTMPHLCVDQLGGGPTWCGI